MGLKGNLGGLDGDTIRYVIGLDSLDGSAYSSVRCCKRVCADHNGNLK